MELFVLLIVHQDTMAAKLIILVTLVVGCAHSVLILAVLHARNAKQQVGELTIS